MPTSPRLRAPALFAVATASAALLLPSVFPPAAFAAGSPGDTKGDAEKPKPPARMSTVGGGRLGQPGTLVDPGAGAPALPKGLTSRSWIVSDAESGEVLASHNAHWKLAPASTLKMLFADTVLPKFPKSMKHKVEPSDLEGMGEGSSLVGVKEGQTYSVHDLWRGVFLRSGNDAVHALAAMNGGVEKTVAAMNAHARELNATDTNVVSPDGYDRKGQVSSAYDLTLFARSGLRNADFREYASTADANFPGEEEKGKNGKKKRDYFGIQNTNRLLTGDLDLDPYPGIAGVKNGTTTKAGSTFTGVAERGDRVLLVTAMHPEKEGTLPVYKETAKLFDWGFEAAGKVEPVGRLVKPGEAAASPGGPGEGTSHVRGHGQAGGAGEEGDHGKAAGEPSGGGVGVAIGITGAALVLLAVVAYAVHRRWPLPELGRLRRRPSKH